MPLTPKGEKIKANMDKEYGQEKGDSVFYASKNKGTITGVEPPGAKKYSYHDYIVDLRKKASKPK